jgi:hypothetical protein
MAKKVISHSVFGDPPNDTQPHQLIIVFFGNQVLVLLGGNSPALRFIPIEKSGCLLQSGLGGAVSGTIRGCNVREIAVSRNKQNGSWGHEPWL